VHVLHHYVENCFKLQYYSAFSLDDRKGIRPAKNLSGGMLACLSALVKMQILHMAQLMPLPLTISCSSKSRLVLPFWCRLTQVILDKIQVGRKTVGCVYNSIVYYQA